MRRAGAAALLVVVLGGCTSQADGGRPRTGQPGPVSEAPSTSCGSPVVTDALPKWARTGFSDDGSGTPHVIGRAGDILGVLFGDPLSAPPAADHGNKILWVSRFPAMMGDTLRITAVRAGTTEKAERTVDGGPGPSIIDLPEPGCWRFTLQWNGHRDSMDLTFADPPSPS